MPDSQKLLETFHRKVISQKLHTSNQAAGHGLEWTNFLAVRNYQNATEKFLVSDFCLECQVIPKIEFLVLKWTNFPSFCIL